MNHCFFGTGLWAFPLLVALALLIASGESQGQDGNDVERWLKARDQAVTALREADEKANGDASLEANRALIEADRRLIAEYRRLGDRESLARFQSELIVVLQKFAAGGARRGGVKEVRSSWAEAESLAQDRYGVDDWRTADARAELARLDRFTRLNMEQMRELVEAKELHSMAFAAIRKASTGKHSGLPRSRRKCKRDCSPGRARITP